MTSSLAHVDTPTHRVNGERRARMAKAALPKGENDTTWLLHIGACLDYARRDAGWTVDRLAQELDRDEKQVARWMRGQERTQVDVVFAVSVLRGPFVIALARLADCEVETVVRIRRTA